MRLLLDTHTIIWLTYAPERVPNQAKAAIAEADTIFVSIVSAWEHGIKRLKYPNLFPDTFGVLIGTAAFETLDLVFDCHSYAESLPPIHSDPFDRMLIAQAIHHDLTLITNDRAIARYPVPTLW